jgi:cell fate regulator YaaT (PSP1 superfamily)
MSQPTPADSADAGDNARDDFLHPDKSKDQPARTPPDDSDQDDARQEPIVIDRPKSRFTGAEDDDPLEKLEVATNEAPQFIQEVEVDPNARMADPNAKGSANAPQQANSSDGEAAANGQTAIAQSSAPPEPAPAAVSKIMVRYGLMRQMGEFSHHLEAVPPPGTKIVIRSERGVEIGEVVVGVASGQGCHRCISCGQLGAFLKTCGPEYPFRRDGKVLRVANSQDLIDQRHLDNCAREEVRFCRQLIRERRLDMRAVTVEHLLGGERIIFYFTAEVRVDFRDMVKDLASQYRTRIEMRQVGARDEARLVADFERCGQQCCCQEYLKDLKPVSMRMAKVQKATLDPSKISGRCGRLMCCLRYEDETYEQLRKKLPRKNIWVRTQTQIGRVVDSQIITQMVRLLLSDNTLAAVPNEDIIERDCQPPAAWLAAMNNPPPARKEPLERSERRMLRDESGLAAAAGVAAAGTPQDQTGDVSGVASQGAQAPTDHDAALPAATQAPSQGQPAGQALGAPCGGTGQRDGQDQRDGQGRPRRRRRRGRGGSGQRQSQGAQQGGQPQRASGPGEGPSPQRAPGVSDGALGGQPSDAAAWQAAPAQGIPQPASADDPQQARIAGDGSPGAPPATGRPGQGQQGGQGQEHRGRRRRRRHHGHGGQRPPGTQGPQA